MGEPDLTGIPREGETVAGKYRIERILGVGGMGVVVAAKHLLLNQDVALKFLLPLLACQPLLASRFLREAQAAAAIQSEHVARVLDVSTLDTGAPYIVMEYLRGHDLKELVEQRGGLSIEDAVDYILQACEALAEAHKLGLVHRDLKPSNFFLTRRADESPLIKLLDFGIAKALGPEEHSLTSTGASMGSPSYMSPEQVRNSKTVDPRADIWSIGASLQEMLTGQPPFEAETLPALCAMIVADPPVRLRSVRPGMPEALEAVILRCLEKDPERRFRNVASLARALLPFAAPRSRLSVERILKVLPSDDFSDTLLASSSRQGASLPDAAAASDSRGTTRSPLQISSAPAAETAASMSSELPAQQSQASMPRAKIAGALGLSAIAIAAVGAVLWGRSETTTETVQAGVEASSASLAPSAPAVRPSASLETAAPAASSPASSSAAPSAKPVVLPSAFPASTPRAPPKGTRPGDPFADQH